MGNAQQGFRLVPQIKVGEDWIFDGEMVRILKADTKTVEFGFLLNTHYPNLTFSRKKFRKSALWWGYGTTKKA